jgi:lysophospholipase L1-like esterase
MTRRRVMLAAGLALAAACHQDELFTPPVPPYAGGAMFQRYVAVGNSITAGWQSGGINDSLQRLAYPQVVAGAMGGDPFYYPSLVAPGCPPPYTNIFAGTRLGVGSTGTTCLFRNPNLPPYLNNLGVPFAFTADPPRNGGPITPVNPLAQLILGGRTQVQLMRAARPTFVSVWIGNNDLLIPASDAANAGDTTQLTPLAAFRADYGAILDSIAAVGAKAILIGVVKITAAPFFSQGQTYFSIKNTTTNFPANFQVAANCGPPPGGVGDSVLVPFPYGLGLIGQAQADPGNTYTLDCSVPQVIVPRELALFAQAADSMNAFDSTQAAARGWAWLNPNPTVDSLRAVPGQFAPFPNNTVACTGSPFGLAVSCDGVHPSTATQRLIARKVVQAINAKYGSAIPIPAVP